MARKIEAKLQDKFINLLKRDEILHIKTIGGMTWLPKGNGEFIPIRQKEGFADVIVFYQHWKFGQGYCNPWTIFIELKTDTGNLRDSQIEKFNQLKKLGFDCFILRPKHWEQAKLKGKLSFENLLEEMERY